MPRPSRATTPVIAATKAQHAEYVLRALDLGLVPGRDLGSSPVNLAIAHAYGVAIPVEEITPMAWVELESVACPRRNSPSLSPSR